MLANGAAELVSAAVGKSDPASIARVPGQIVHSATLRNGLRRRGEHEQDFQQKETKVAKISRRHRELLLRLLRCLLFSLGCRWPRRSADALLFTCAESSGI